MEIENQKKTIFINKMRYITVIVFIVLLVVMLTTDMIKGEFLGLTRYHWAILLALIYLGQNVFEYLKDYNYIYYNDNGDKILFRYISLRPFKSKKYSIEINKDRFHSYKVQRASPFKREIIFFIKTPQGIAKYPPISISALNEDDFNNLKKALNQYL